MQFQDLDLNVLIENILQLVTENIMPITILLSLLIYWGFRTLRDSNDKNTMAIRDEWSAISHSQPLLTDQFYATVGDYDRGSFSFSGELFQIDSQTYDSTVEVQSALVLTDDQVKEIEEKNANTSNFDDHVEIHTHRETEEKYIIETHKSIEKRKSVTGLARIPHPSGGKLVAIRRSDLRETETIISETEQQKLVYLDPTLTLKHTRFALFGVMVYEFVLLYMMLTETDPALLFAPSSYPWYVLLVVVWILRVRADEQKIGFKALYRGMLLGEESFKVYSKIGEPLTITVPVYEVELHFHPLIPIKNVLKGVGKEEIENKTTKTLERRVKQLSAEKASLNARLEQMNEILAHKDTQLVYAKSEHTKSFNDGFMTGYMRHQVKNDPEPTMPMVAGGNGTTAIDWFRELKLPMIFILVLVAGYYLLQGLTEGLSNTVNGDGGFNFFSSNMLLGMFAIILLLLILSRWTKS